MTLTCQIPSVGMVRTVDVILVSTIILYKYVAFLSKNVIKQIMCIN